MSTNAVETKNKVGPPTKYSLELAERLAVELTHNTVKKACANVGIHHDTYYEWMFKYEELSELSTKARKTKAINHYEDCQEVLEETRFARQSGDTEFRVDLARLEADFHLRLAGKANQGLFGDQAKNQVDMTVTHKDIDAPARQGEKEWTENIDKE